MNVPQENPIKIHLPNENIDRMIGLLDSFRTDIRQCEEDYYWKDYHWNWEFNLDYWYERFFIPTIICVDIVATSNTFLTWILNPWAEYQRNFSWVEHIFTLKPSSNDVFLQSIWYLRSLLIPLTLMYLHAAKNPENQTWNQKIVWDISRMVNMAITLRSEDQKGKIREAIVKWEKYFIS